MAAYTFDDFDAAEARRAGMNDSRGHTAGKKNLPLHLVRQQNQERVELIMSFYRALKEFRDLTGRPGPNGAPICFEDFDRLIEGYMRPVKDSCHRLFRESSTGASDGILQAMFDMYFGILFHIMLKAKENLRLGENYNLRRMEELLSGLRSDGRSHDLPPGVNQLFDRLADEFERDTEELEGEMERARFMFDQLEAIFNRVIQVYHDNPTIIRSLYCHKEFFAELFPDEGLDRVLARIYPQNGPAEAYFLLGFDYLRSGHAVEAERVFQLAVKAARRHHVSPARMRQLCDQYRTQILAELASHSDRARAVQERLKEMQELPALRFLFAAATDGERQPALDAAPSRAAIL